MTITYADAKTPKTLAGLRALFLAALDAAGSPVAGMSARAPQRVLIDDFCSRTAEESEIRAEMARLVDANQVALDATDLGWADAFATWFDEERIHALPAVWDLSLTTSTPPQSVGPSTQMLIQTSGGIVFAMTQATPVSLPSPARFTARLAGVSGNVSSPSFGGGKILTGPSGIDAVSAVLFTAGRSAETNSALIRRCLAKWGILGAGWTLEAFDYRIPKAAPTLTRWKVRRDSPRGPGTTEAILGNTAGPATTAERDAVQAEMSARSVQPLGSGAFFATIAGLDALALSVTVLGDGSNANLQGDIEAALAALGGIGVIGPAVLSLDIVRAVALGAAFTALDVDDGTGTLTKVAVNIPGFLGAASILSCSLVADYPVANNAVLVLTPSATVA
jgi:hypothetical protein